MTIDFSKYRETGLSAVTMKSTATGITRTKLLPVSPEQVARWQTGAYIQEAMPHLSTTDREFMISGTCREEWAELFSLDE